MASTKQYVNIHLYINMLKVAPNISALSQTVSSASKLLKGRTDMYHRGDHPFGMTGGPAGIMGDLQDELVMGRGATGRHHHRAHGDMDGDDRLQAEVEALKEGVSSIFNECDFGSPQFQQVPQLDEILSSLPTSISGSCLRIALLNPT
jgi:hypothetical protein